MTFSTFSGPVRVGTQRYNPGRNTGLVALTQSYDYAVSGTVTSGTNVDALVATVPAGSQIVNILVDQVVVPNGSSVSTVSVGTSSGGAQLMAAVTTTAGGRFTGVATAATQLAWQTSTTADTPIYVRYAVSVANATAGRAIVTIVYVQRAPDGSQNPTTFEN